ncbi:hypothetical protein GP486_000408 [Trichoglossum hirsutum]|uniref:Uncharacterized protein n=1 Tax=Trichoglossum hirsutum TaxID=265104 RepID=A0A9P8LJ15_9PEZI|nr:hypothetical protein GP486_000408 [Trichoglossum hirsutum]
MPLALTPWPKAASQSVPTPKAVPPKVSPLHSWSKSNPVPSAIAPYGKMFGGGLEKPNCSGIGILADAALKFPWGDAVLAQRQDGPGRTQPFANNSDADGLNC